MPIDPDVQPLLDAKADKSALATKTNVSTTTALTARVAALETWRASVVAELAALQAHNHDSKYSVLSHDHGSTPPPDPTPDPSPIPGAIQITPATTGLIASAPAGATFQFAAGLYKRLQIAPKADQTFVANPGVVMDGENATVAAFRPTTAPAPNNVTIKGFEIKNYTPYESNGWNEGAITSIWYGDQGGGDNWLVENCDVHHNRGAGVMLSNKGTVRNCHIHHNYSIGLKLYWAPDGGLVEGNEIDNNNFDGPPDFNETGGTKFAWTGTQGLPLTGLIVRSNNVHHNRGPGLWTDIFNYGTVYESNVTEDNDCAGIMHEVSFDAIIKKNQVRRNGFKAQGSWLTPPDTWGWGAGICIANSAGVLVGGSVADANIVEANASQIMFIHQNRIPPIGAQGTGPVQFQTGGTVKSNQIKGPGKVGAVQDVGNGSYFAGKVKYEDNDYTGAPKFVFGGGDLDYAQWKLLGHDVTGSYA